MSDLSEFYITLMSNADTDIFHSNTLASFSNNIPRNSPLNDFDGWHVALHSMGISTKFYNIKNPADVTQPSFKIIIRSKGPKILGKLGLFEPNQADLFNPNEYEKSFVESLLQQPTDFMEILSHDTDIFGLDKNEIIKKHYSRYKNKDFSNPCPLDLNFCAESLLEYESQKTFEVIRDDIEVRFSDEFLSVDQIKGAFNILSTMNIPLLVEIKEGCNFSILAKNDRLFENFAYTVMIHSSAVENFQIQKQSLRKTKFRGGDYFCKDFNSKFDMLVGQSRNWFYNYPEVVMVECEQMKEHVCNSKSEKYLSFVSPVFKSSEVYSNFLATVDQFHPLANKYIDKFTIRLKNLKNETISLLPGPATYVKLLFKKMDSPPTFNIKLANNKSSFETILPQPVCLENKSWRVTLNSICFPNEYLPLPSSLNRRKVWYFDENEIKISTLPNMSYASTDMLINTLNQIFNKGSISFTIQHGKLCIKSGLKHTQLGFSKDIAQILGYDDCTDPGDNATTSLKITEVSKANVPFVCVNFTSKISEVLCFKNNIQLDYLKPKYLMVYANIIDHCIVGSKYVKLLRIVPIRQYTENTYELHDFARPEFHGLESTYFDSITIEIRDHTGELVNFINKKLVLNLFFSCE